MISEYAGTNAGLSLVTELGLYYKGERVEYDGEQWETLSSVVFEKIAARQEGGDLTAGQRGTFAVALNLNAPASETLTYSVAADGTASRA